MGSAAAFAGTSRFAIERALGAGGMGVVYLAHDRERRMPVALKTLQGAGPANLARLKNEFRALADLSHPNLVGLYELFAEDGHWFFTMEVVDGARFDAWCASVPRLDEPDLLITTRVRAREQTRDLRAASVETSVEPAANDARVARPVADLERLARALRGLTDGVEALHRAGKLHCDLKPSNVLVTAEGRVVVLDFGLVKERARDPGEPGESLEGTPEYVAPEQVRGLPPTFASDWYQVGVMLFQALAGRPPFRGEHHLATLLAKLDAEAPRVSTVVEGVPPALDALVAALLVRDPDARAGGAAIRAWLEGSSLPPEIERAPVDPPFVGRAREQAVLAAELARAAAGEPRFVVVRGPSGMGKSALIRRFAEGLERDGRAIVLAARCYEREEVPFKALDGVVDAIAARLARMPGKQVSAIVPEGAGALALLFPVLGAVDEIARMPVPDLDTTSPGAVRALAAEAARALLERWSSETPIVMIIDDLQWGDADSAAFIGQVVDPGSSTRVLMIAGVRVESEERPVVRAIEHALADRRVEIELGPLDPGESASLAASLLGGSALAGSHRADMPRDLDRAAAIAADAAGVPFFVTELARHAERGRGPASSVDEVIASRAAELADAPRALLELTAIAGVPLAASTLARAAGIETDSLALVRQLSARSLVRSAGADARSIEPYHDRIREVIAAGMDGARRRSAHASLGGVLAGDPAADPESVAHHLARGGDPRRALPFQVRAAERASRALAFDRAVSLHERALELAGPEERTARRAALAEALVLAGRSADAAPIFVECAESASDPAERSLFERRAAEEWLKSGRIDEGVAMLRRVLAAVSLRYPDAQVEALARAIVRIVRIRRLDGSFVERADPSVAALARADAARAAGVGLMMVDPLRGYGFLARFLLDAIEAGEPRRVAAGLCLNAVTLCRGGEAGYPRAKQWLESARAIGDRQDDEYLRGLADACEAGASVCTGRWKDGARLGLTAPARLRSTGTPATWECTAAVSLARSSLLFLGELASLRDHAGRHLRAAEDVGDRFAATYARVHSWFGAAMDGDVARGRAELDDALARWSRLGFHAMHFWSLYGQLQYDLYEGEPLRGLERLEAARADLKRSRILAMQFYAAFLTATEAHLELARAQEMASERDARLRKVDALAKPLGAMGRPYTDGLAALVRGRAEAIRGRPGHARAALERALERFGASDMALHVAAADAQRGALLGGDLGRVAVERARETVRAQGVIDPDRYLAMLGGA